MADDSQLLSRAEEYADSKGIRLIGKDMLGYGSDGSVWHSSRRTAVKALYHQKNFDNELECYRRLKAASVRHIGMFDVPFLEDFDKDRRILEISIVQPPYLLDFGKVYLDHAPTHLYDEQMMENANAEWHERFGKRWSKVLHAMKLLEQHGIYYYDPRPGNVCFGDEDDQEL
ncbi:MAG: hypothetical protein WD971_05115 [Pirellulales bacterium]